MTVTRENRSETEGFYTAGENKGRRESELNPLVKSILEALRIILKWE
jgi:hypothetical protein